MKNKTYFPLLLRLSSSPIDTKLPSDLRVALFPQQKAGTGS